MTPGSIVGSETYPQILEASMCDTDVYVTQLMCCRLTAAKLAPPRLPQQLCVAISQVRHSKLQQRSLEPQPPRPQQLKPLLPIQRLVLNPPQLGDSRLRKGLRMAGNSTPRLVGALYSTPLQQALHSPEVINGFHTFKLCTRVAQ